MLVSSLRRRSGGPNEDANNGGTRSLLNSKDDEGKIPASKNAITFAAVVLCLGLAYGLFSTDSVVRESSSMDQQNQQPTHLRVKSTQTSPAEPTCGIWMAPGSLKPYPGFGIYTTRDIPEDGKFLHSPDAISVQVMEPRRLDNIPLAKERAQWWKLFQNYAWDHSVPDHARYAHVSGDMTDFQPGFGSLPNHHCILNSLSSRQPDVPYDDTVVDRAISPGLGAFSYTMGREWVSKRDVRAGEELFLSYGFCERTKEKSKWSWADKMFMPEDFEEAARLVKLFEPLGDQPWPKNNLTIARLIDESSNAYPKLVYEILPKTQQEIDHLVNLVNQHAFDPKTSDRELVRELARGVTNQRTPEWIRQNGMCLENLVPKKSTIPDAGWGGFAQYPIKKDEIIVPMPTLHMGNKDVMRIYDHKDNVLDDPQKHEIGKNMFLNYCFGRPESSMVLCPLTSAVLVNHCSTRQNNGCEPNAKIQWSSGWDPPSFEWRNVSLPDLAMHNARVLSLEMVATKPIAPGEEVFIDYGIEWEEAWKKHVKQWKAPHLPMDFISAKDVNLQQEIPDELISRSLRETVKHPYIFAGCVYRPGNVDEDGEKYQTPNENWKNLTNNEIMKRYASSGSKYVHGSRGYRKHAMMLHWPCSILFPDTDDDTYIVRIHQTPLGKKKIDQTIWFKNDLPRILYEYPRDSIHFFVEPEAADHNLPDAFRHHIGLPDGIFPTHWNNL
jgi:hypothetical protein